MKQWHIQSERIRAVVNQTGAMLGQLVVDMGNGSFQPLAIAPWVDDPRKDTLAPILRQLQGEWLCVPFGITKPLSDFPMAKLPPKAVNLDSLINNDVPHGITSNLNWTLVDQKQDSLTLEIIFPDYYPIEKAIRVIKLNDEINGVELSCKVTAREAVSIPLGIHPTFAVSEQPFQTRILCSGYSIGKTYPIEFDPSSEFKIGQEFQSLGAVPRKNGEAEDTTYFPFSANREELVQLLNIDSSVEIERLDLGYKSILEWESSKLPHCCLWMSSKGRREYPWLSRHLALGVEPTHSYFDLNSSLALDENTQHKHGLVTLTPNSPFEMNYSIRFKKM
jgi:galactose mutarotase-like enzyme